MGHDFLLLLDDLLVAGREGLREFGLNLGDDAEPQRVRALADTFFANHDDVGLAVRVWRVDGDTLTPVAEHGRASILERVAAQLEGADHDLSLSVSARFGLLVLCVSASPSYGSGGRLVVGGSRVWYSAASDVLPLALGAL